MNEKNLYEKRRNPDASESSNQVVEKNQKIIWPAYLFLLVVIGSLLSFNYFLDNTIGGKFSYEAYKWTLNSIVCFYIVFLYWYWNDIKTVEFISAILFISVAVLMAVYILETDYRVVIIDPIHRILKIPSAIYFDFFGRTFAIMFGLSIFWFIFGPPYLSSQSHPQRRKPEWGVHRNTKGFLD